MVAVTHGGFLAALHRELLGRNGPPVNNCGLCEVLSSGTVHVLVSWNEQPGTAEQQPTFGGGEFG